MCRNFTYEVVDNVENYKQFKKIVAQKINVILFETLYSNPLILVSP
jgi:hypothetical protein